MLRYYTSRGLQTDITNSISNYAFYPRAFRFHFAPITANLDCGRRNRSTTTAGRSAATTQEDERDWRKYLLDDGDGDRRGGDDASFSKANARVARSGRGPEGSAQQRAVGENEGETSNSATSGLFRRHIAQDTEERDHDPKTFARLIANAGRSRRRKVFRLLRFHPDGEFKPQYIYHDGDVRADEQLYGGNPPTSIGCAVESRQPAQNSAQPRAVAEDGGNASNTRTSNLIWRHIGQLPWQQDHSSEHFEAAVKQGHKNWRDDKRSRWVGYRDDGEITVRHFKSYGISVRERLRRRFRRWQKNRPSGTEEIVEDGESSGNRAQSEIANPYYLNKVESQDPFRVERLEEAIDDLTYAPPKIPATLRKMIGQRELHEQPLPRRRQWRKRLNKRPSQGRTAPRFRRWLTRRRDGGGSDG